MKILSRIALLLLVGSLFCPAWLSAQSRLFYAGSSGAEIFNDVVQLSDGTILIAGAADDLSWLPPGLNEIDLGTATIANNQGTNRFAFLLHADSALDNLLNIAYLSQGAAEDIRFIKTTNAPRTRTGEMFISGSTEDTDDGGYFIAKLDNNFVDGLPTGLVWSYNAKCTAGDYPKNYQPWDVDARGRVYFARGDSHDFNWSIMHRLDRDGNLDIVENWRLHWIAAGGEFRGTPASSYSGGSGALSHSGVLFKKGGRCALRSWTQADYDFWQPDGNGGTKKGKWPLDVLYAAPCDPAAASQSTSGPGYTGYATPSGSITYGPSSICIDRRTDDLYLGLNSKSRLPGGNPDFEPAVVAFDSSGALRWWSRLYHEVRPDSTAWVSEPDQYIDGLAIDYSLPLPQSELVVDARCHGNNVENFWEGDVIAANPGANAFQNRFTGSSGNIHISWLGKLATGDGTLHHSTYVAEYAEGASGLGAALTDPLLDGWPNPNAGWPEVNTTRLQQNALKVTADGSVIIIGTGRRTMTTANAHQKMPRPGGGGFSAWNQFVRQYRNDFAQPDYSSLVRGTWDTLNTQPGNNTELMAAFKTRSGIIVVGQHLGADGEVPVANVPAWGSAT
ncbi:MAG: hypothetical protein AAF998_29355, partial [Bacteroidota bacterium]